MMKEVDPIKYFEIATLYSRYVNSWGGKFIKLCQLLKIICIWLYHFWLFFIKYYYIVLWSQQRDYSSEFFSFTQILDIVLFLLLITVNIKHIAYFVMLLFKHIRFFKKCCKVSVNQIIQKERYKYAVF